MIKEFLETGKVVGTHGVRGMLRVQPWCDDGEFLTNFKKLYINDMGSEFIEVKKAQSHGNIVLLTVTHCDSIEKAEKFRGKVLYIKRSDVKLPKGRYFISDLIGCTVYHSETNEVLGELFDVSKTGANDVWHIKKNDREYLVPVISDVLVNIKPEEGFVSIKPLKGIFDDED